MNLKEIIRKATRSFGFELTKFNGGDNLYPGVCADILTTYSNVKVS